MTVDRTIAVANGFTLIELLVVVSIIGILSTLGLISLNGAREKARDTQRKYDIAQMQAALTLFFDDNNNRYPLQANTSISANADCVNSAGVTVDVPVVPAFAAGATGAANAWSSSGVMVPEYLSRILRPPQIGTNWQSVYCYDTNEGHPTTPRSSFTIWAGLEAAGGGTFFTVKQNGLTATTLPAAACSAQAICP